jgi:hypothetical protein
VIATSPNAFDHFFTQHTQVGAGSSVVIEMAVDICVVMERKTFFVASVPCVLFAPGFHLLVYLGEI